MSGKVTDAVATFKSTKRDKLAVLCQEKVANGSTQDEIIVFLHTQKLGLGDATDIFINIFGGSFWETASLFHKHAEWREEVEEMERLTMESIECLLNDDESDEDDSKA